MVTLEMLANLVLPELTERRYTASPELNPSAIFPAVGSDCPPVSVIRVMVDVLEELVPLAHLERLDQR